MTSNSLNELISHLEILKEDLISLAKQNSVSYLKYQKAITYIRSAAALDKSENDLRAMEEAGYSWTYEALKARKLLKSIGEL